jgi:hypothetical protein
MNNRSGITYQLSLRFNHCREDPNLHHLEYTFPLNQIGGYPNIVELPRRKCHFHLGTILP